MTGWDLAIFITVTTFLLGGSFRKARSSETFLVANRRVSLLPLTATLVMTEFNTATLLAFASLGYLVGPRAIGLSGVFLIGLAWYTITVARKWKQYNGVSVAGWFTLRYGRSLGRTVAFLLILAMVGFSSAYVKSLTLLMTFAVGDVSPWLLSGVFCLLIAAVTVSGGLASVVRLDVFGFVMTLVLLPALLGIAWWKLDGLAAWQTSSAAGAPLNADYWLRWDDPQLPWSFVISLVVLTCLTYISSPWYGQKIFAASSERTAVLSVAIASVLIFFLYASVQLAASLLAAEVPQLADPQLAVPRMIDLWLPGGFQGLAYAVLFAIATTTLAGVWNAMVAMSVSDFGGSWIEQVSVQRCLTMLFAAASWLGGNLLVDDILNRLILANIPVAALAFALLGGFYWHGASRTGAWASIVMGTTWGTFCFLFWGEAGGYTWYWTIVGTPIIFGTGIVASLMFPDPALTSESCQAETRFEAATFQTTNSRRGARLLRSP